MLRKILTTAILLSGTLVFAQEKKNDKIAPKKEEEKIDYKLRDAPMHSIRLVTLDTLPPEVKGKKQKKMRKRDINDTVYKQQITKEYTEKDFDNKEPLFVMIFNPTCGHCEDMTDRLQKSISTFKKSRLILMANPGMKTYLPDFIKNHKVNDYFPQMVCGLDSAGFINETFMYSALPQINIYSKDRKLIKSYSGEVEIDSLKQFIK